MRNINLIKVYLELSKLESPAIKNLVKKMEEYGKLELSGMITLESIRAVLVGLLSTKESPLILEDIPLESVSDFRSYLAPRQ